MKNIACGVESVDGQKRRTNMVAKRDRAIMYSYADLFI